MDENILVMVPHLKVGSRYLFDHKRKGPFVGEFRGTSATEEGDEDPFLMEVDIYTEDGSGQERLANCFIRDELGRKMRPPISKKLIRPSLLRSITAPSVDYRKILLEQFSQARHRAETQNLEPQALPTAKALELIGTEAKPPEEKPALSWWKKMFGGG